MTTNDRGSYDQGMCPAVRGGDPVPDRPGQLPRVAPGVITVVCSPGRPARRRLGAGQFDRVLDALADKLPRVAEHLEAARADVLVFADFPKKVWRQIWSNIPSERLNR
jgi:hypothetical protein